MDKKLLVKGGDLTRGVHHIPPKGRPSVVYTPYQVSAITRAVTDLILLDTRQISRDSFVNFWAGVYMEAAKNQDVFLYNLAANLFKAAKMM
jgi:hypothetical protein